MLMELFIDVSQIQEDCVFVILMFQEFCVDISSSSKG